MLALVGSTAECHVESQMWIHVAQMAMKPISVAMSARPLIVSMEFCKLVPGQTVQGEGNRHIGRDYMKGAPDRSRRDARANCASQKSVVTVAVWSPITEPAVLH